jgi:DNA-binding protein H-NS
MGIDLNTLSGDELIALKRDADKALHSLDARNRTEALKAAEAAAREHGYTLKELMGGKSASTKAAGQIRKSRRCEPNLDRKRPPA